MSLGFWLRWSGRDLRRRGTQVVAIAAILGLGSAIYSGLGSTSAWRRLSLEASLTRSAAHDVEVRLLGDTTTDATALADAVRAGAGTGAAVDVVLVARRPVVARTPAGARVPAAGEVVGTPLSPRATVDRWTVVAGRDLEPTDAGQPIALLDLHFARAHDLPDHGRLLVGGAPVRYVGLALSPRYLNLTTTSGEVVQGQASRAVLFTSLATARSLAGTTGDAVSGAVVRLPRAARAGTAATSVERSLAGALPGVPLEVTTRADDRSLVALDREIGSEQRVFDVFALLVLGGAAFAAFGLTKRVVEAQRREIGIAMALGVPRARIAVRTVLFALEVTLLGVLLGVGAGVAIGAWVFSIVKGQLPFPVWETPFQAATFARAALATLVIPMAASAVPVLRSVRARPVDAFLPPQLRGGGHRLAGLMRRLELPGTMLLQAPLRRILRSPLRSCVTVLAIAFVMAPLLAALGAGDSAARTVSTGERIVGGGGGGERLLVSLVGYQPGSSDLLARLRATEGVQHVAVGLDTGGFLRRGRTRVPVSVALVDLADPTAAPPGVDAGRVPDGGLVISEKAAQDLGAGVGDRVTFRHPVRSGTSFVWRDDVVPIGATFDSPYRFVAYLDLSDRSLFGLEGLVGSARVVPEPGTSVDELQERLGALPGVASALPSSAVTATTRDLMSTLRRLFLVLQGVIAVLAFLVAFNATHVAADERRRQHATMLAFGIRVRRVVGMQTGESVLLGALGVALGLALGAGVLRWILDTVFPAAAPDLAVQQVVAPSSVAITVAVGLVATAAAPLLDVRSLRRMDLPETLRHVE